MKAQTLVEAIHAGNEYLQIITNTKPEVTIRQVEDEEMNSKSVQVAQSKPSEMEIFLQARRQLTSKVVS